MQFTVKILMSVSVIYGLCNVLVVGLLDCVSTEILAITETYLQVSVPPRPCCTDNGWKGMGEGSEPGVYLHRRQLLHLQLLLLSLVLLQYGLVKAKFSYDTAYERGCM